jgi:hypothetical protein
MAALTITAAVAPRSQDGQRGAHFGAPANAFLLSGDGQSGRPVM